MRIDLESLDRKFGEKIANDLFPLLIRHGITCEKFLCDLENDNIIQTIVINDIKQHHAFKRKFPEEVVNHEYCSFARAVSLIQGQGNGGGRNGGKGEEVLLLLSSMFSRPPKKGDLTLKSDPSRSIQVKHGEARINDGTVTCGSFKEKFLNIAAKHKLNLYSDLEDIPNFLPEHRNGYVKDSPLPLKGKTNFASLDEQVSRSENPVTCWFDILTALFSQPRTVLTYKSIELCLDQDLRADPTMLGVLVKDAMCHEQDEELLFFSPNYLSYAPSLKKGLNFVSLHMRRSAQEVVRIYVEPTNK